VTRHARQVVLALAALAAVAVGAAPAPGSSPATLSASTDTVARARQVARAVDARYAGLRITEASSTAVIESLRLFDDPLNPRLVPASNGIYFSVCPNRARCPYPARRAARRPGALAPRRVALDLAVHTFLETSADLVVVSLPTTAFIVLVFERTLLDAPDVSDVLTAHPPGDTSAPLRSVVDANTLPRLYRPFGLESTPTGRDSLLAFPLPAR
jgi:hypothetical protein